MRNHSVKIMWNGVPFCGVHMCSLDHHILVYIPILWLCMSKVCFCPMFYMIRELLTVMAGKGWNSGRLWHLGKIRGLQTFWRFTGGQRKPFGDILPKICMSILWHHCTMVFMHSREGRDNFLCIWGGPWKCLPS